MYIKVERLLEKGEPDKNKPIVYEARVIDVIRGDRQKYAPLITVSRASRRLAGYCQRPSYSVMRIPPIGEQLITAFSCTTSGVYRETDGAYIYTPELLSQVKERIKKLSKDTD
ncbi:MAG: hypothetical protein K2X93_16385 [Candidatus Obscuribacterales bacterium]|nr:hypothetical protein [Candidatus Obscuribacterales bacterium]